MPINSVSHLLPLSPKYDTNASPKKMPTAMTPRVCESNERCTHLHYHRHLTPVIFRYGGDIAMSNDNLKLECIHGYTGDIVHCTDLPFTDTFDFGGCVTREGYRSTLVLCGGAQFAGLEMECKSFNTTYFYAPWMIQEYKKSKMEHNDKSNTQRKSITPHEKRLSGAAPIPKRLSLISNDKAAKDGATQPSPHHHPLLSRSSSYNSNHATRMSYRFPPDAAPLRVSGHERYSKSAVLKISAQSSNCSDSDRDRDNDAEEEQHFFYEQEFADDEWFKGPTMQQKRSGHGVVAWDEHIVFVAGGMCDSTRLSSVEYLRMDKFRNMDSLKRLDWTSCRSMKIAKSGVLMCHWKPRTSIVCVGNNSNVVEAYDPYKNVWRFLPPLSYQNYSNKSSLLWFDEGHTDVLLMTSWSQGQVATIEFLDERLRQWQVVDAKHAQVLNQKLFDPSNRGINHGFLRHLTSIV
ncbi:hypothetical protein RFI_21955 [Reticulomyxa filosa]|uniref:Kelch repeat-containing protein n=1 Tax=Reticulomyxa filosa TaxID=46433 RepID=X6MP42_RETFI|nr:hypothetical protein RFI_21955 [Reticulomyxa filosa]|eukprot:ETO15406.1 hypothetical protein RFI_21955 [Reticulomyxa filosa]